MLKRLLHSSSLFYLAMKVVTLPVPRRHKQLDQAVPVQRITRETKTAFVNCIDTKMVELIDISLEDNAIAEFATTQESLPQIIESLLTAEKNTTNAYIKVCRFSFSSKNFIFLKSTIKLLARLSRKVHFFIAHGNNINPSLYSDNTGVILHSCKFNSARNAHIKQADDCPTTINRSILKADAFNKTSTVKAIIPRSTTVNFPVDAVYTWAGKEENIKAPEKTTLHESATSQSRFSNFDELKYSLRSLSMNANFFNKIYIVIAGEPPEWLNKNRPKISIVRHADIFQDSSHLPTYNSHAIESQLHHIKDIAEHFIYLNDDVFFLSPCYAGDFFYPNGIAKQFVEEKFAIPLSVENTNLIPADKACCNSRELMAAKFNAYFSFKYKHAPFAINKNDVISLENLFYENYKTTSGATHRSNRDIATTSSLIHFYSYYVGNSIPSSITNLLINLDSPRLPIQTLKLLNKKSIKTMCLNENYLSHPHSDKFYNFSRQLVKSFFPLQSEFEN